MKDIIACNSFPNMNLCAFIGVEDRKESDCIIMDNPLKEIKKHIKEMFWGESVVDKILQPLVISIMPDIIPSEKQGFMGVADKILPKRFEKNFIIFKLVKRSINKEKSAI